MGVTKMLQMTKLKRNSLSADIDVQNTTDNYLYYDEADNINLDYFAPCNNVNTFGKVFLPTLFSMVFVLSFIGMYLCV